MQATSFDRCFGWLHSGTGDSVIVFCNAYGHEALLSHRGIRKLAEQLHARRLSVLRFDYVGTGDSAGSEEDGEQTEQWLSSIEQAIWHIREALGLRKIILCGLRLGAMLAALAAERLQDRAPVDGLILMSPVASGKDYLRELKLIQRRWRNTPGNMPDTPEGLVAGTVETFGFRLNALSVAQLEMLDLAGDTRKPAAIPVLLFDADAHPSPKLAAAINAYRKVGSDVQRVDFADETAYLGDRVSAAVPKESLEAICHWIDVYFGMPPPDAHAMSVLPNVPMQAIDGGGTMTLLGADSAITPIEIRDETYVEVPVLLNNGRVFGIYCRPIGVDEAQTAVLFPNTGGNHHIGDARIWVIQARHLARRGVASLRMDITGLGDSADDVDRSTAAGLHSASAWEDASAGVDWLATKGHTQPVIVGICSGAFIAFNAAIRNPRVAGVVLINQWIFTYEPKRHGLHGQLPKPTRVYRNALGSVERWKRVLRDKGKLKMVASVVSWRMIERIRQTLAPIADVLPRRNPPPSSPLSVRAMTRALAERGVRMRIIFGASDPGIEEFEIYFGKGFQRLKRFSTVEVSIESTIDHALFLYPARERILRLVDVFLHEHVSLPPRVSP